MRGGGRELGGGWRSGLGNLSSFSINHQLACAARPVTCSEKAAPSGLWKLGAKTNLAPGLPEGLPHPLLTCRLCSFFFFSSALQAQESPACAPVLRVPLRSAGFSRSVVRSPPSGLRGTQRPRPGPAPSRGPAPPSTPLGLRTGPKPRLQLSLQLSLQALLERGWAPSPIRLCSPRPSPASGPVARGAAPLAPPRLRLPPKTFPVGPAPTVTLGMGPSLGLPHSTSSRRALPG